MQNNWDDKILLKQELSKRDTPVPIYMSFNSLSITNLETIFEKFQKPIIVKPRVGSRGRHTVTNIHTLEQFKAGVEIVKQICPVVSVEEHLMGDVCRATFVSGKLMGFYRGMSPVVIGDGQKTVEQLITEKDAHRNERVEKVLVNKEMEDYVARAGYSMQDVLPAGLRLSLTYRTGRLFGGATREMLDELHPSFVPILTEAAKLVGWPVIGFDCIVPDPTKDASAQRWGIIECNTLPFIDLHYYALEGKPKNIAGAIWDMWKN
jgi:D-alanine-D-alanine ligase-like ATP-grasp enzyme